MDYQAIRNELDTDPLSVGYSGFTDEQVVVALNSVDSPYGRDVIKASITGAEVYEATDGTEFSALTDAQKAQWLALCAVEKVNPTNGTPGVTLATDLFGGGSQTITNLQALRSETISRAQELGLGVIIIGDVQNARAL